MRIALVQNGTVINVVISDDIEIIRENTEDDIDVIACDGELLGIGWTLDESGEFVQPLLDIEPL
ncbi:TPA: hypothetical protein U2L64_001520 [Citrobacter koseri]|uniref:hypothetical protein n=1 Tax=Citrobacter koseri TaxID=545 RepID=UPI00190607AE|nr:hypothetical protein [Citrobacter koseri]EKW1004072.1 hypothetical protein [Citrobacter koseri]ELG4624305.1 hypothetical protein [Citrobacter koseri]MBJ9109621.1 hypothetical protein [Citrobacter koseri]HEM7952282.1 hypothetical protein [Citrobacter koseri]HEM7988584.1 hypothetical protein [Citrobacter koseri]